MTHRMKIVILWLLLIAILGLLTTNAFLYRELRKYYALLYNSQLDPIGLSYFQEATDQIARDKPTVVFYGDSRAAQWVAPQTDKYAFINRGIGNQTSAQVLLRFEEHIQPLQPDTIILQVCVNDLKTIPLFPESKDEIIAACENNIEAIIQRSRGLNSVVILTTIFPTSGNVPLARRLVWSDDVYEAIDRVNAFILDYQAEGVIVFDSAGILANSAGNVKSEYVFDLLHLNSAGYNALNSELLTILDNLTTAK